MSPFWNWHAKELSSQRVAQKGDVLQDRNIHCLRARPCIFQPGNFTGWGSEGVNENIKMDLTVAHLNAEIILAVAV